MGKKIRMYSIFILFLLMSVSVFAAGIRTRVEEIDSKNYNVIKINLISITNNDVESMKIINLKEERKGSSKDYDPIQAERVEFEDGTIIKIGTKDYIVRNNKTTTKVTGYNKKQYIYGWTGTYDTQFTAAKGEERIVSFSAERVLNINRKSKHTVTGLSGTYTEPNTIDPDPVYPVDPVLDDEVTIEAGNGHGNEIVNGWLESLVYTSTGREIKIILESANNGSKDVKELDETIAGNGTVTTYENDVKIGRYYTLTQNGNQWILTYNSNLTANPGERVEICFYIGKGNGKGNRNKILLYYTVPQPPKDIVGIKTYEEIYQSDNVIEELDGYKFTKGGAGSYVTDPSIYVVIPEDEEEDEEGMRITKLKIETTTKDEDDEDVFTEETYDLSGQTGNVEINYDSFGEEGEFIEGANTVQITPINAYGVLGTPKKLKFVVDTQVNDTYLEGRIIGELDDSGKVVIDLSNLKELSGVVGYSYKFTVGEEKKTGSNKDSINDHSFTTLQSNSTDKIVIIDPSGLIAGSKGTLSFTVYDKLGHEKEFEKTYFLPAKPSGITSRIEGEVKERNSKIKIVTEGNKDKFGVERNIDGSSE